MSAQQPKALAMPGGAADPVTGLIVRAVIPVAETTWWAEFREDGKEAQRWHTPVVAWAECITREGEWAGLFPVVVTPARLEAEIADPAAGYKGLSRATRGHVRAWPE